MKLTVENLLALGPVIGNLSAQPLKATDAYKVGRLAKSLGPEAESAQKARIALMKEHGATEAEGIITLPPDRLQGYLDALKPLLESEVTITAVDPLLLSVLKDAQLSAQEMMLLEDLHLIVP